VQQKQRFLQIFVAVALIVAVARTRERHQNGREDFGGCVSRHDAAFVYCSIYPCGMLYSIDELARDDRIFV